MEAVGLDSLLSYRVLVRYEQMCDHFAHSAVSSGNFVDIIEKCGMLSDNMTHASQHSSPERSSGCLSRRQMWLLVLISAIPRY